MLEIVLVPTKHVAVAKGPFPVSREETVHSGFKSMKIESGSAGNVWSFPSCVRANWHAPLVIGAILKFSTLQILGELLTTLTGRPDEDLGAIE